MSTKDRSLILFFIVSIIVAWSIFSAISFLYDSSKQSNLIINKIVKTDKKNWINLVEPLQKEDLKNKIIILNFWNYSCQSCIQNIDKLKKLKAKERDGVLIIGIHVKFFNDDSKLQAIKKAVEKYDINFPVIDDLDSKLYNEFSIKSLPTYILINPLGKVKNTYSNSQAIKNLEKDANFLAKKYRYRLNKKPVNILLEKNNLVKTILKSPSRLSFTSEFKVNSENKPAIFISDVSTNNILVTSTSGKILEKIGNSKLGFEDGSFESASFNNPQGMTFEANKLYISDSGNNAIRVADFDKRSVETIIGDGQVGGIVENSIKPVANSRLNSPSDIEFFPDYNNLLIANSGTNQILTFNVRDKTLTAFVGSGKLGLKDGAGKEAELAQPLDLYAYKNEVYFIDSKSSSLRKADVNGNVKTLVGKKIGSFGHRNGSAAEALMQNPTSLTVDDTGAYIVDSLNHIIRRYNFETNTVSDYESFSDNFKENILKLDEPSSIVSMADRFYISDTNNSRIITIKRSNYETSLFDIIPSQKIKKGNIINFTINKETVKDIKLPANSDIKLSLNYGQGWKINDYAPSYLNLLEMENNSSAKLIKLIDWKDLKNNSTTLPQLKANNSYFLQGLIYFCEDKKNSLCYIKEIQQNLIIESKEHKNTIEINLTK